MQDRVLVLERKPWQATTWRAYVLELVSMTFFWLLYINFFLFKPHGKIFVEIPGPRFGYFVMMWWLSRK